MLVSTLAAGSLAAGGAKGESKAAAAPVPSLEPAATARLFRQLVQHPRHFQAAADCRPLRGVFYTESDWLRLATKLAANASPCAEYYISVPPFTSDKTKLRPSQAAQIRALGTNFHALAEIQFTAWSTYVASTGSTWFDAGVEARRRMADAGFDVTKGDTWAVNEFPSSVRTGAGSARANVREFVRGLYQGDGTNPSKGVAFIIGVGQGTTPLAPYQGVVQSWYTDAAFWADIAAYVSDWSQEVYGDFRNYAVPGQSIQTRRDYLNDYLQHPIVLARVAPPVVQPTRNYLESAYSPLAQAAWQWGSGYGWTLIPFDQMQSFVSAQVYALRYFSATTGEPQDHWGFAWSPKNATGLASGDFDRQSGAILDRPAAAIHDSGETADPNDPGTGACGPPGQNQFCDADFPGAQFIGSWQSFRTWTQPVVAFTSQPQTIPAGTPSAAIGLALLAPNGAPQIPSAPVSIALSSSSPTGQFSTAATGPWSSTLTLTVPAGSNVAPPFYYQDTKAGSPTITAAASGFTTGEQTETVQPGPPTTVTVNPGFASVTALGSRGFTAAEVDAFGNPATAPVAWSVAPGSLGTVQPSTGATTTFTAGPRGGTATLTATVQGATGPVSATAALTVTPGVVRVASLRYGVGKTRLFLTATVVDSGRRPVRAARVTVLVRHNGGKWFSGGATSGVNGKALYRFPTKPGCYRAAVRSLVAAGYRWDRSTPVNRLCK